jgi:hypothetical protein
LLCGLELERLPGEIEQRQVTLPGMGLDRGEQEFATDALQWARIGDRRQTEVALDRGRRLLEVMPYPDNIGHHFVVDPTKFDFYAMDCYRHLAEDRMAENLADEVIQASTDFDGIERAPMRLAKHESLVALWLPAKVT